MFLLQEIECFITCTKSAVYLLRLVDGQTPVLGKFYYCCALLDKHLRIMKEAGTVPYIDQMRSIFMKRWKRWHRPIHTFAYAVDPCYQEHELTRHEKADCLQVDCPAPLQYHLTSNDHQLACTTITTTLMLLLEGHQEGGGRRLAQAEGRV